MISDALKETVKEHNQQLVQASVNRSNPLGDTTTYSPYHVHHMLTSTKTQGLHIENGALFDHDDPVDFEKGLLIGVRIGDPKKGGGSAMGFRHFPRKSSQEELDRLLRFSGSFVFNLAIRGFEHVYAQSTFSEDPLFDPFLYFSDEEPVQHRGQITDHRINLSKIERMLGEITSPTKKELNLYASFRFTEAHRYIHNSEGSDVSDQEFMGSIFLSAKRPDSDGRNILLADIIYFREPSDMPTRQELERRIKGLAKKVDLIRKSPLQNAGDYPVIFDGENTGVLFHEVVGHGLEGHRINGSSDEIAYAFKGMIGAQVAPGFINLYDDPRKIDFGGVKLNGHYLYDDECVPGRRVQLFENGVLRNYLHSRASAGEMDVQSNGHSRSDFESSPVPRMGNLFVESTSPVSQQRLRELLIEEVRKQNKAYGLRFVGCNAGLTLPEESFYNTSPIEVYRVYPDGHEERVRGVYVVGTPRQTLSNIVAMGDDYQVFNGYCGAESGYVPSAQIAPSCLIRNLEVNVIPNSSYDFSFPFVY